MNPETKICTKCGREKSRDEFHKKSASKDGLFASCKECVAARQAAWYAKPENKARVAARQAARQAAWSAKPENKARRVAREAINRPATSSTRKFFALLNFSSQLNQNQKPTVKP